MRITLEKAWDLVPWFNLSKEAEQWRQKDEH